MFNRKLSVGDKIKIYTIDKKNEEKQYISQIEDFFEGGKIKISTPMELGKVVPLHINEEYIFDFYTSNALFRSKAIIVDRSKDNNFYFLIIQLSQELRRIQRRDFFRIDCLIPLEYNVIMESVEEMDDMNAEGGSKEVEYIEQGYINNISAGGIKFSSNILIEEGTFIECRFPIEINKNKQFIKEKIKVLYKDMLNNAGYKYSYRGKYHNMSPLIRDKIIKYVFELQIKQKGK